MGPTCLTLHANTERSQEQCNNKPGAVAQASNSSTQETRPGEPLLTLKTSHGYFVSSKPACVDYRARSCLKQEHKGAKGEKSLSVG